MQNVSRVKETALELFKYCPLCKAALKERAVCDILILGLTCADHHHFFLALEPVPSDQHQGQFLGLSSNRQSRDEIARDWLGSHHLRRHLNHQVAEVLRLFLEVKDNAYSSMKQNEAAKAGMDNFCPVCADNKLKLFDQNGYQVGKSCTNSHRFWYRGTKLVHFTQDGDRLELCLDLNYGTLVDLAGLFTTKSEWERMISPQVRELLKQYADEFLKDNPTA